MKKQDLITEKYQKLQKSGAKQAQLRCLYSSENPPDYESSKPEVLLKVSSLKVMVTGTVKKTGGFTDNYLGNISDTIFIGKKC